MSNPNKQKDSWLVDKFENLDKYLEQELETINTYHEERGTLHTKNYWAEKNRVVEAIKMKKKELLKRITSIKGGDLKTQKPSGWKWLDRQKGEYYFEDVTFKQGGRVRKKVFQTLMDIFESSGVISTKKASEMSGLDPYRLRVEISGINIRLIRDVGLVFKGSGRGYYFIQKIDNN